MIAINGQAVDIQHFPDNTQLLKLENVVVEKVIRIEWTYERDEELVTLIFLSKHLRERFPYIEQELEMPYVPNARMDRTKKDKEVFTLKYFCEVINSLDFKQVFILDPHSNVAPALIKNIKVMNKELTTFIEGALELRGLEGNPGYKPVEYVYFPDEGAMKRYSDMPEFEGKQILVGHKKRDWSTGKIVGLRITSPDDIEFEDGHFQGCSILMVDDIISYGGTLAYSADELKVLGFKHIYAYATHVENSILDEEKGTLLKRLNDGTVDRIYTTDSLFTGKHPKITTFWVLNTIDY